MNPASPWCRLLSPRSPLRQAGRLRSRTRTNRSLHLEKLELRSLMAADLAVELADQAGLTAATETAVAAVRPAAVLVGYKSSDDRPGGEGFAVAGSRELLPGLWKLELAEASTDAALAALAADPRVEFAEPDQRLTADALPDDTHFTRQWGLHNRGQTNGLKDADIDAPAAWKTSTGKGTTIVAVVDSGIDWKHPDLRGNIWVNADEIPGNGIDDDRNGYVDDIRGWDFFDNDNNPMDEDGHGTHVAGIIGARGDNDRGVAGVSWNVQLMPVRFLGPDGGTISDAVSALYYAVSNGATISNNSWGWVGSYSQALGQAVSYARSQGHLLVTSAGNDGMSLDDYYAFPASYNRWFDNVITVAATNHKDKLANFSNYGEHVDIAAPGVNILSTVLRSDGDKGMKGYDSYNGTSMAAPFVTGALALLHDVQPSWNYRELIDHVLGTADEPSRLSGAVAEGRRLNVGRAIRQAAAGTRASVSSAAGNSAPPAAGQATADSALRVRPHRLTEAAEDDGCEEDIADRAAAEAASAVPEHAKYEITVKGKVNGKSFEITGKLLVRPTMNQYTLNDLNERDIFLQIGDPLARPKQGAIWLATNNAFFGSKGYIPASQAMDLARVNVNDAKGTVKVRVDQDLVHSGLNRFNASSGLLASMYQIYQGGLDLRFTQGGKKLKGTIDLKGTTAYIPGFVRGAVDYEATITGKRIS